MVFFFGLRGCTCLCDRNHGDMLLITNPFRLLAHDFPCVHSSSLLGVPCHKKWNLLEIFILRGLHSAPGHIGLILGYNNLHRMWRLVLGPSSFWTSTRLSILLKAKKIMEFLVFLSSVPRSGNRFWWLYSLAGSLVWWTLQREMWPHLTSPSITYFPFF